MTAPVARPAATLPPMLSISSICSTSSFLYFFFSLSFAFFASLSEIRNPPVVCPSLSLDISPSFTQLGTSLPPFFLVPFALYPSQHVDAPTFLRACFKPSVATVGLISTLFFTPFS